jgi:HEPN domain-containing protein
MDSKVKYWVDIANYDFRTAKAMLKTRRYLYVGFMCHQTIEKLLKAIYTKKMNKTAPFSHNLSFIANEAGIYTEFSVFQKNFIDELQPLNVESRYPSIKDSVFQYLTKEKCKEILTKTEELLNWITAKLLEN